MTFQERYQYNPTTDLLGKGGFARVYKAKDVLLDRDVAIKIFNVKDQDHYTVVEEIKKVIKLKHLNLLAYYDVAIIEHTTPLGENETIQIGVMELANAGDLKQFAQKNPNSPLLFKLLQQVLNGLEYLHGKGIIHRDLKPQNILLVEEDGELIAKISDFGISKNMESGTNSSSMAIGTIEYMAPEQFSPNKYGINGKISTNVDLWSFGVMVHELVTNTSPFGSRNGNTTAEQIMNAILTSELPEDIKNIPEPYQTIIKKCLVSDAKLRIQKANDIIGLLDNSSTSSSEAASLDTIVLPKQTYAQETQVIDKSKIANDATVVLEKNASKSIKQATAEKNFKWVWIVGGLAILLSLIVVVPDYIKTQEQENAKQLKLQIQQEAFKKEQERFRPFLTKLEQNRVAIPAGSFSMGSASGEADEKPVHDVSVRGFYMSKYEVTVADFKTFVEVTGYQTDAEKEGTSYIDGKDGFTEAKGIIWRDSETGNHRQESDYNKPVIHVSWNDADAYCKWLTKITGKPYRLPTEAEWEYAAGNGAKHTKYSWGSFEPSKHDKVGNVADETSYKGFVHTDKFNGYNDGNWYASPVGSFKSNDFGLYDMTGNVWEWCGDWYDETYYANSSGTNPKGPTSGSDRVLRGGSWSNYPAYCRVVYRDFDAPGRRTGNIGFRVVAPQ